MNMRSNFSALALWRTTVTTDEKGFIEVPFKVPDSITRYRIMSLATWGASHYGVGEGAVSAQLPIALRPSAPRFLNYGDDATLPCLVQNNTSEPMRVRVVVRTQNLKITEGIALVPCPLINHHPSE